MSAQMEKIALFIDGANLYATAKSLGFDIDYKRLLREFQSRGLSGARVLLHRRDRGSGIFVDPAADRLARLQRLHRRHQADQGIRRLDRPAQGQGQHGHRARGRRHGDRAAHRSDGAVLRRRRFPLAGRGGAAPRRARRRWSRPSRRSRRWSPTNCAARPISSSTSSSCRTRSAAIRANARRASRGTARRAASRATRRNSCSAAPAAPRVEVEVEDEFDDDVKSTCRRRPADRPRPDAGDARPRLSALPASRRFSQTRGASASPTGSMPRCPPSGRRRAAADRRPGARPARRQPHRTAVHRRLCRRPALRDAARNSALPAATIGHAPTTASTLVDCRITNAVRCVPPENKPTPQEITTCRDFLAATIEEMPKLARHPRARPHRPRDIVVATLGARRSASRSATARAHALGALTLFDSYHCSRYNTNTGVLTPQDVPRRDSAHVTPDARPARESLTGIIAPRRSQAMTSSAFLSGGNTG